MYIFSVDLLDIFIIVIVIDLQFLNNVIIIKTKDSSPSGIGDHSRFLLSRLVPLVLLLPNTFKLFGFPIF
jgi:hypothetical protein